MIEYRMYRPADEEHWLRCRVLAFLDSPYYENVITKKPTYETDALELIASDGNDLLGFMDTQFEQRAGSLCYGSGDVGAVIWELGIHPDFRRQRIASRLLEKTIAECDSRGGKRIQAWTRASPTTRGWYESLGFRSIFRYWHVWLNGQKLRSMIEQPIPDLTPVHAYCEYTGDDIERVAQISDRIEECLCYERLIT